MSDPRWKRGRTFGKEGFAYDAVAQKQDHRGVVHVIARRGNILVHFLSGSKSPFPETEEVIIAEGVQGVPSIDIWSFENLEVGCPMEGGQIFNWFANPNEFPDPSHNNEEPEPKGLSVDRRKILWDGEPIKQIGAYECLALSCWNNEPGFRIDDYLSDLEGLGYTRLFLEDHSDKRGGVEFGKQTWPWIEKDKKFNFTEFNDYWWDRLKIFLRGTQKRRIVSELAIFNPEGARKEWPDSPWVKNVHGLDIENADDLYTKKHARILEYQKLFIDKLLEETKSYKYIIFEIANEGGDREWVEEIYNYLRQKTDRLISVCDSYSNYNGKVGKNDIVNFHGSTLDFDKIQQRAEEYQQCGKPFNLNEYYMANVNNSMPGTPEDVKYVAEILDDYEGGFGYYWWGWRWGKSPTKILEYLKQISTKD